MVSIKKSRYKDVWPINRNLKINEPVGWKGWPKGKKFAVVLTHDVDTAKGQDRCMNVLKLEKELGFRSSFYFVPERYDVSRELISQLKRHGFEVGVHDLNHDGKLYSSENIFRKRAARINRYLEEWKSVGFRSGAMHHNLEWIHHLNIEYDASTFDTDPFEPQPDGMETIFPVWIEGNHRQTGYVELPYTIPQDFTLFVLMKEKTIDIWKEKLDWIAENGGMALLITHPDYMSFNESRKSFDEYPMELYREFLAYLKENYAGQYWQALPREAVSYYKYICFSSRTIGFQG